MVGGLGFIQSTFIFIVNRLAQGNRTADDWECAVSRNDDLVFPEVTLNVSGSRIASYVLVLFVLQIRIGYHWT